MGIKDFHKCIKEKYPKSLSNKFLDSYNHILVDINFALHYCSYGAKNEEEIYSRLYNFFDIILQDLTPTKTLTVASDGVAPLAKLILQRKRRSTISKSTSDSKEFSTLIFTPGTEFMMNLNIKMENYFNYVKNAYCIDVNFIKNVNDEAELKLKKAITDIMEHNYNDSFIFVTNDADVIVMLCALKNTSNTFIYTKSGKGNDILSIGKLLDEHTNDVGMTYNYGNDFTLIGTMLGNDYIPKINYIDFTKIWAAYKCFSKKYKYGLIDDKSNINKKFLSNIMSHILINMKKGMIKKIKPFHNNKEIYADYFDGLLWCFDMYKTGICSRYNYMYQNELSPNPLGIICAIQLYPDYLILDKSISEPTDISLYAILVLPKSSKKLINNKYHKFIESSTILYEQEDCKKCNTINQKKTDDNIKEITKELSLHKKVHKNINFDDIVKISKKFNKLYH
jgi:5'-3' exonuclease